MLIGIREIEQKYEIVAKLGEGGMGSVYQARHKLLDEMRVIKTIKPQLQSDEDLQNRFLREAQVAAKMRHAHIAALHDFAFTDDGTAYIVMQHVVGQNLRDYQRQGGRLTVEQVVVIGRQALAALGYLHAKSFVHRDISTDNMMLGWHGGQPHVTLIDLGLAKSLEGSEWRTKTGMVVGKVRYISPEQLNSGVSGVEVDARSDLYSFGVVLYELLTGEYPITGADDMSLIAGHLYRSPRPFEETDPGAKIPEALRHVVLRALEKKPEYRYASAEEFSSALELARTAGDGIDDGLEPTIALSAGQVESVRPGAPGSPIPPASPGNPVTLAASGEALATRPAVAPGDAPFTRPNVPQPQPASAEGTQPVGSATQPVPAETADGPAASGRAGAETAHVDPLPAGRPELARSGAGPIQAGPVSTIEIDHDAVTAPISVPGSKTGPGAGPKAATATSSSTPSGGRRGMLLAAVAMVFVLALAAWQLGWLGGEQAGGAADSGELASASGSGSLEAGQGSTKAEADDVGGIFWGQHHALVIGNNAYEKLPPLESAVHDARAVAEVLERRYGFRVTLLENADRAAMANALYEVGRPLGGRDSLLVYYAGHGTIGSLDSPYWQPVDADPTRTENWISTEHEVADLLDQFDVRHALVIADSCFAGANGADLVPPEASVAPPSEPTRELQRRPSRLVLASGGFAPVLDAGRGRHSIFAQALLDALENNGAPLGASELYRQIAPRVDRSAAEVDFEQRPTLIAMPSSKDEGGELFFVPHENTDANG